MNHASNICSIRQPIKKIGELCQIINAERGYYSFYGDTPTSHISVPKRAEHHCDSQLYYIVDAAQTAGNTKIDICKCNIDALCAPGHKGLYGPAGSGFVLFGNRVSKFSDKLNTLIEGGSGSSSFDTNMPDTLPERFEAGSISLPAISGLNEGIKFIKKYGEDTIGEHEFLLGHKLSEFLQNISGIKVYLPQHYGNIVLFNALGIPSEEMADCLNEKKICVRAGLHCAPLAHKMLGTENGGAVRASIGMFNTDEEVEQFVMAIKSIIKGRTKNVTPKGACSL